MRLLFSGAQLRALLKACREVGDRFEEWGEAERNTLWNAQRKIREELERREKADG